MTITVFVEKEVLENFIDFLDWSTSEEFEQNGNIIRRRWHLDRNVTGGTELVQTQVSYDQYITLADNE